MRSSIGNACLMPEFTKRRNEVSVDLTKLTAKLDSSVHFVQSSRLLCEVPWSIYDPEYIDKKLVNKEKFIKIKKTDKHNSDKDNTLSLFYILFLKQKKRVI